MSFNWGMALAGGLAEGSHQIDSYLEKQQKLEDKRLDQLREDRKNTATLARQMALAKYNKTSLNPSYWDPTQGRFITNEEAAGMTDEQRKNLVSADERKNNLEINKQRGILNLKETAKTKKQEEEDRKQAKLLGLSLSEYLKQKAKNDIGLGGNKGDKRINDAMSVVAKTFSNGEDGIHILSLADFQALAGQLTMQIGGENKKLPSSVLGAKVYSTISRLEAKAKQIVKQEVEKRKHDGKPWNELSADEIAAKNREALSGLLKKELGGGGTTPKGDPARGKKLFEQLQRGQTPSQKSHGAQGSWGAPDNGGQQGGQKAGILNQPMNDQVNLGQIADKTVQAIRKSPALAQKFNNYMLSIGRKVVDLNQVAADDIVKFARWLKETESHPYGVFPTE